MNFIDKVKKCWAYRNPINKIREFCFMNQKPLLKMSIGGAFLQQNCGIITTVAFNNSVTIDYQIRSFHKFLLAPYHLIIADNSTDEVISLQIEELCRKNDVGYVRLPHNPYSGKFGSASHGAALNYVWKHFLKESNAKWFGFTDHDLYLVDKVDISEIMKENSMYGRVVRGQANEYMWPGLVFCRKDFFLKKKILDFKPGHGVDTGGHVFELINQYRQAEEVAVEVEMDESDICGRKSYELYDKTWLHMHDLTNSVGFKGAEKKESVVYSIIDRRLKTE